MASAESSSPLGGEDTQEPSWDDSLPNLRKVMHTIGEERKLWIDRYLSWAMAQATAGKVERARDNFSNALILSRGDNLLQAHILTERAKMYKQHEGFYYAAVDLEQAFELLTTVPFNESVESFGGFILELSTEAQEEMRKLTWPYRGEQSTLESDEALQHSANEWRNGTS